MGRPPTGKLPRINTTFSKPTHEAIAKIAELSGSSRSRVVADIVEEHTKILQQLAVVMEKARDLKGKMTPDEQDQLKFSMNDTEFYLACKAQNAAEEFEGLVDEVSRVHEAHNLGSDG